MASGVAIPGQSLMSMNALLEDVSDDSYLVCRLLTDIDSIVSPVVGHSHVPFVAAWCSG